MKSVKTFVFAALLVFSLAFNTVAGEVEVPGKTPPPPLTAYADPVITSTDTQETGNVTTESSDYLFYEALAALLSVY